MKLQLDCRRKQACLLWNDIEARGTNTVRPVLSRSARRCSCMFRVQSSSRARCRAINVIIQQQRDSNPMQSTCCACRDVHMHSTARTSV